MQKEITKISSGSSVFDKLLKGGLESDIVTTIFGPSGTGKSNFCLSVLSEVLSSKKKAVFIDTERSFSIDRFKQLNPDTYQDKLDSLLLLEAKNYEELSKIFSSLKSLFIDHSIGIIIIDSIANFYRLELAKGEHKQSNIDLSLWMHLLCEIAATHHIPILMTSQVYADFNEKDRVSIIGGDIVRYSSKCLIELSYINGRIATIRKHRSIADGSSVLFEIWNEGLIESDN